MPRQVTLQLSSFEDGLSKSVYQGGKKQFAPGTYDIDFTTDPGIIQPVIGMVRDLGDLGTRVIRAMIKASDGTYYWVGTNASTQLQVWTGGPGSSTTLTTSGSGNASFTNMLEGSKLVEFDGFLWFYASTTNLTKFNIGTPALTTGQGTVTTSTSHGGDLLVYKSFLYYINDNSVGRATNNTTFNNTALTLETNRQITCLAPWFGKVIVGSVFQNEALNSRLTVWDGVSTLPDYHVEIPDNGISAIVNNEGVIYILCNSNPLGNARRNIIRIYAWAGGDKVQLVRELDLESTSSNLIRLVPSSVDVYKGKIYFTIDAGTADTMNIDNGVYTLDRKGMLNLEYVDGGATEDTTDLAAFWCKWMDGELYWFYSDGTTNFRQHLPGITYSSNARLDTLSLQFDPRYEARIDEIFFRTVSLPASTSVAVSISTDQASFSAVKTFDADNATANLVTNQNDFAFQPGHTHQLRFAFTSSSASRVRVILPIFIKATVFDSQTLTS